MNYEYLAKICLLIVQKFQEQQEIQEYTDPTPTTGEGE